MFVSNFCSCCRCCAPIEAPKSEAICNRLKRPRLVIAIEKVDTLRRLVQDGFNPDLTLLLDVEPDVSRGRISDRELDRIEKENLEFYQRVRAGYLDLAEKLERIKLIDASMNLESVGSEIRRHLSEFIFSLKNDSAIADR